MTGPRDELCRRLEAALLKAGIAEPDRAARIVTALFYKVNDSWDKVDVSTLATDGREELHHRSLVAEWPVQAVRFDRIADRRIAEESGRG